MILTRFLAPENRYEENFFNYRRECFFGIGHFGDVSPIASYRSVFIAYGVVLFAKFQKIIRSPHGASGLWKNHHRVSEK